MALNALLALLKNLQQAAFVLVHRYLFVVVTAAAAVAIAITVAIAIAVTISIAIALLVLYTVEDDAEVAQLLILVRLLQHLDMLLHRMALAGNDEVNTGVLRQCKGVA